MKNFSKRLIGWYQKNKRDLPWRGLHDPYPVWLSEIILQQTRVDQGMSYYFKFLELFPTVHHLAAATEDQVLKAWQGLGYYSRARNLHATARMVVKNYKGKFPQSYAELLKLKGIGPYTAAAIASFCYNEKTAVVDGNVMRVLARLHGMHEPVDSVEGINKMKQLAAECLDQKDPGTYNQAIMEFGAMHCTPYQPKCSSCPFEIDCVALQSDTVSMLPIKGKKTAVKDVWFYYFFITHGPNVYMKRRNAEGIWKGLHDFPCTESDKPMKDEEVTEEFLTQNKLASKAVVHDISEEYVHILSHRKIRAKFIEIKTTKAWKTAPEGTFEAQIADIEKYGVPRLIDKYLKSKGLV